MTDPAQIAKSLSEARAIVAMLDNTRRKAMLTRDGHGEYSSATLRKLKHLGLVDDSFRWTDLGLAVRAILEETP